MNLVLKAKLLRAQHWLVAQVVMVALGLMRLFPPQTAISFISRLSTWIGPLTSRHRLALENLRLAMPEKSKEEHRRIARGMWANMGLLAAEYVYLDQIFDFDPEASEPGRIEVEGAEIFERVHKADKPAIFFTAHTGNFELLPICAATFGLEVTALFRPPNNPYIARKVLAARQTTMGTLVPSKAGAAWALAQALDKGKSVGLLVDQKFARGAHTNFFDQPVHTNPLLAKLARQFDVAVHPARCIRLPGGRFKLILEEAIDIPKTASGDVDMLETCQVLNDKVESWVREYPDQWMWFHRRWQILGEARLKR